MWDSELEQAYYNYRYYAPIHGRWERRDELEENNLYAYIYNQSIRIFDNLGLKYNIANEPEKIMVLSSDINGDAGRLEIDLPKITYSGTYWLFWAEIKLEDRTLKPKMKIAKNNEVYISILNYMNKEGGRYTIKDVKDKIESHELTHFKDYLRRIRPLVNELNQYEGITCNDTLKLVQYLSAYINFVKCQIELEGTKLDIKDYVGDAVNLAKSKLPKKQKEYNTAKKRFKQAKKAFKG